jgi:predicted DNA-binding transcriptional regulator YafY
MKFIEQLQRLERLDQLIRLKATGNAASLARRMGCSRRTIYHLLDILKALGAEIAYCNHRQSFYYTNEVYFDFTFVSLD